MYTSMGIVKVKNGVKLHNVKVLVKLLYEKGSWGSGAELGTEWSSQKGI